MTRFVRRDNGHGGWTILDQVLGYRICSHHRHVHGGIHVHGPPPANEVVTTLPELSMGRAESVMRRYARHHERFDPDLLRKEVRVWRSG